MKKLAKSVSLLLALLLAACGALAQGAPLRYNREERVCGSCRDPAHFFVFLQTTG